MLPQGSVGSYWSSMVDGIGNVLSKQPSATGEGHDRTTSDSESGPVAESMKQEEKEQKNDYRTIQRAIVPFYQDEGGNLRSRRLGVSWKDLTVHGARKDLMVHENVFSQFNAAQQSRESKQKKLEGGSIILDNVHGCVKPGEMLLVVGKPGSGCTTLLNMLANRRHGYQKVDGEVHYGHLAHDEAIKYHGQIVMSTDEELFFPSLSVGQTMDFATKLKAPARYPNEFANPQEYQKAFKRVLLDLLGIGHTVDTKVGDAFIRGVSGGERKRVSIVEALATRASVFCWDDTTRGLDASTALGWARVIRAMTDALGLVTIASLYQVGNGIFDLFDKVLVLDQGKEIFYGHRSEARPFMESLGFICDESANIADFLTGVTVPTERKVRPEHAHSYPRTATEIRAIYSCSDIKKRTDVDLEYNLSEKAAQDTSEFVESMKASGFTNLNKDSPEMLPFHVQTMNCIIRQGQLMWGDKATLVVKQLSTLIQALLAGSLFYDAPPNSAGLFIKSGALFWSLLYQTLVAMSETTDTFAGRPVLAKHKEFALYRPAALCLAQFATDIPVLAMQITIFGVVVYWMTALKATAAAFFTYLVIIFSSSLSMTAFFRFCGAAFPTFDAASKVSGFAVNTLAIYVGFMIPKPEMHPWFVWIYWINPLSYPYESLMINEFSDAVIPCVGNNLVPSGEGYNGSGFAACAGVRGATTSSAVVTGDQYLASISYSRHNLWRNFGIILAWWALFAGLTIFFTSRWKLANTGGTLLVPRERVSKDKVTHCDEESQDLPRLRDTRPSPAVNSHSEQSQVSLGGLHQNTSVFTWKNLSYTITTPSGERKLLDNISGCVKPGMLGALMGSSGAGKTTLMDVLAQRKTQGRISGSILVDGREVPVSFQRSVGYCEQRDIQEPFATVREALEFSALLRQNKSIPDEEKLQYVDTVIELLELRDLEHSMIGTIGAGLSVEQRKRVTIGVELVAKPSILIFLDEPTSGLDGQSAYSILRFLKKLTATGQAVFCTIHQPSALIFAQFDYLLLLSSGGRVVYQGDIGNNAVKVRNYFERYGAPCPPGTNPAEHMIDVVSGSSGKDWHQVWLSSPEHQAVMTELDQTIEEAASKPSGTPDDGRQFATSLTKQTRLVTRRMNLALYRNTEYIMNKISLHILSALVNGFTFWMIGNSVQDLQNTLFAIFNFIFVAPGTIAQLQPIFLDRRDIFETRERKANIYHWMPFVTGLIISELPYLIVCAFFYFVCFYFTVGFPTDANAAGGVFFVMLMYEFLYTGIGQSIAAYAPNDVFAALVNPLIISVFISFCGVLVPYSQLSAFWRYWMYYLNPFTYLMGSLLTFTLIDKSVECASNEFAIFDTPNQQTCLDYLAEYLDGAGSRAYLANPNATSQCQVCQYRAGLDYLNTLNLNGTANGWRDASIVVIFVLSSYAMVYAMMKLRTKATKKAEGGN